MKKLLAGAAFAAMMVAAGGAMAADFDLVSKAPTQCTVSGGNAGTTVAVDVINKATGVVKETSNVDVDAGTTVSCTGGTGTSTVIGVKSANGGMYLANSRSNNGANQHFNYSVTAEVNGVAGLLVSMTTDGTAADQSATSAAVAAPTAAGALNLTIGTVAGTAALEAGSYQDKLTVLVGTGL